MRPEQARARWADLERRRLKPWQAIAAVAAGMILMGLLEALSGYGQGST